MVSDFRYYLRVRYAECDAQKVVFNARYGDYIDLAVLEYLRAAGLGPKLIAGPWDYQLVRQTISWRSGARFDQVLELTVKAARTGNTSFAMSVEIRRAGEPEPLAEAETVYVLVDAATLAKAPLTESLRRAIETGAKGQVCDQSGTSGTAAG